MTHHGVISARKLNRARVLLLSDEGHPNGRKTDPEIAEVLDISTATVGHIRRRFVQKGLEAALNEKPRSGRPKQISGSQRAAVTALACSEPPEGYAKWSLRLLADKVVELELIEHISHTKVGDILKDNELKPHLKRQWCLGKLTSLFLWRMEDILHLYEQPYDPKHPLICVDERPCQLIGDVLVPLPMEPGKPKREGYQYKRNGVCTIFIAFEPLTGKRIVQVRKRRTKKDYAQFMKYVAETHYPDAERIIVVQDNLNTHNPSSFYEILSPQDIAWPEWTIQFQPKPVGSIWLKLNCPFWPSNVLTDASAISKPLNAR